MRENENFIISDNYILSSFLGVIFIALFGLFLDDNLSILLLILLFILSGIGIVYILNTPENRRNAIYIFIVFFGIYLLYNFLIHIGLINLYGVENIKSDETWFFESSNDAYLKLQYNYDFFEISNISEYKDTSGAIYLYGLIASLANLFGHNSVLVQKVGVSFFASLIPSIMYSLSRLYLSEKISLYVATIYGLFSFVPFFATTLLRDTHIALMYILTIYIVLQKWSLPRFLILLFASFYSYYLREQTGIFMMGFMLIYVFVFIHKTLENKYLKIALYSFIALSAIVIVLNTPFLMDMFYKISDSSSRRSVEHASSGSIGVKIAKLPFGLNVVALFGFGQIQPFPPSLIFKSSHRGILEIEFLLAGIAWFIGWGFLLYGIFKEKILKDLDLKLLLVFLFSILYLVLISVVEFSQRRQMAVYPVVFLMMVFSYLKMDTKMRGYIFFGMILFYLVLVLAINYMKI